MKALPNRIFLILIAIGSCLISSQLFSSQQEQTHHEIVSSDKEASVDDLLSPFIREAHAMLRLPADWTPTPLPNSSEPSNRLSPRDSRRGGNFITLVINIPR